MTAPRQPTVALQSWAAAFGSTTSPSTPAATTVIHPPASAARSVRRATVVAQRRLPPRARSAGPDTARRRSITLQGDCPARAHVWGKQAERSEAVGGIPALGTPETLTDGAGTVTHQTFDPFGTRPDGATGPATRVGYTGQHQDDDLALIDMGGRIYDPLAARFTTADPIMQVPYSSQGQNRYAYVFNDPINNTDPSGFSADGAGVAGGAFAGEMLLGGTGNIAIQSAEHAGMSGASIGASAAGGLGGGLANAVGTLLTNPFGGSGPGTYGVAAPTGAPNANPVKPGGINAVGQGSPPRAVRERSPESYAAGPKNAIPCAKGQEAECRRRAMMFNLTGGGFIPDGALIGVGEALASLWRWLIPAAASAEQAGATAATPVIGPLRGAAALAKQIGGRVFTTAARGERLVAENQRWLDQIIKARQAVRLAAPIEAAEAGSMFEAELNYLIAHGYTADAAGAFLVAP